MSDFPSEEAVQEPKRIQVFGVLHIVFGGLGLLNIALGALIMPLQTVLLRRQLRTASGDEERVMVEFQLRFYEKIGDFNWISWIMGGILAVLILIAGIALLKRRRAGLTISNAYAWTSLAMKVLSIFLFFFLLKPAVEGAMSELMDELGVGSDARGVITFVNIMMAVAGVLGPVLGAIYPILSLVMLNKEAVRLHLKTGENKTV